MRNLLMKSHPSNMYHILYLLFMAKEGKRATCQPCKLGLRIGPMDEAVYLGWLFLIIGEKDGESG